MKIHLANLLLEQYKQQQLSRELQNKGIDISAIVVNNVDIVLDIIGFPQDNSREFDLLSLADIDAIAKPKNPDYDKDLFIRDYLLDRHFDLYDELLNEQSIVLTENGMQIESGASQEKIMEVFIQYVEWLYEKFDELE